MQILHWKIDPDLKRDAEGNYRTRYALSLADRNALTIMRELTFDGATPTIKVADIEALFDLVEKKYLKKKLSGIGLEVGAGPLTFSSILAKRSAVTKMYGVEICAPIVEKLFPVMAQAIVGDRQDKVVGVVGSFDEMELTDRSVDFVFDFFSLHHSLHLPTTLKEIHRILKPGGLLLCFDKARPDRFTQSDLDELMDTVYGESYYRHFGLPLDSRLSRRSNGEREYRLKDWQSALGDANFGQLQYAYLAKSASRHALISWLKESPLQVLVPKSKYDHKFIFEEKNRFFSRLVNPFSKDISLIISFK